MLQCQIFLRKGPFIILSTKWLTIQCFESLPVRNNIPLANETVVRGVAYSITAFPVFVHKSGCKIFLFYLFKQGLYWLEKYLNLDSFLEKSMKFKSALKSTGKSLKSLAKSSNSTIFCRS